MENDTIRFGLIGYGAWGSHHANAISKTLGAELVAVSAKSESTRRAATEAFPDVSVYADYVDLLQREDVDVVSIVLPSYLHHSAGLATLKAGKHLLLEKPMGITVDECDDLIRTAAEKNRVLAVGHELRHSSLWGKVKQMIDDGFVGDPQYVLVELSRMPYRLGSEGWRYDFDKVGSWILEEPIHFFDFARWYLQSAGDPKTVFATANSRQKDHPELHDNFSAIVDFENGAYSVITQTLAAFEHHQTVKVCGTKGSLWAGWSGAKDRTRHPSYFLKASDGKTVEEIPIHKTTGELFELEDEMAMMVRAVRDGEPVVTTGEDGRWSCLMCEAAQKSVETGGRVSLAEME